MCRHAGRGIAWQWVHNGSTKWVHKGDQMPLNNPGSARLTATQLLAIRPKGEEFDVVDRAVPGLILRVGPNGSKRWLFRYRWKRSRPRIALGDFPTIGLAEARERALVHRKAIEDGIDPRRTARPNAHRSRAETCQTSGKAELPTRLPNTSQPSAAACHDPLSLPKPDPNDKQSFHFLAYEYVEFFVKPTRDVPQEVIRILKKDALPYWKDRDARTISPREIIERLDEIVARGAPVMANRTAGIFTQMFKFGVHRSIITSSPVSLLFAPGGKEKSKSRVLSEAELRRFLHGLQYVCRTPVRRHTLMVLLLLLVRRGSLAKATWTEFNFEAKEWNVPAEHDKKRRAHIIPLPDWAIEHLLELKILSKGSRYVLPKRRKDAGDRPANAQLISRSVTRLRKMFTVIGVQPFTPHDLRRTGRTWMGKLGGGQDTGERVLNHSLGEIVETYDLNEYMPQKRGALEKWEFFLRTLHQRLLE
jgi:integrase